MAGVEVDVLGTDVILAAVNGLGELKADVLERRVAVLNQEQVETRIFTGKRDLNNLPWAPWSRAYAATRSAEHSLLIDTGALSESMNIAKVGNATLMGTDISYARKNDIERPFMGLSSNDKEGVKDEITAWVEESMPK